MRQHVDALVTERALAMISMARGAGLLDAIPESRITGMRKVSAQLSPDLVQRLHDTAALLDISRRRFIEAAIVDALDAADRILADEGVPDACRHLAEAPSIRLEFDPC